MQHKGEQMKKVRKILLIFLGICLACTTVSCAKRTEVKKGDSYIYCLNSDRTGLQKVSYESKEKDPLKAAKAMIKELKKPSEEIEYTPPIPKDVKVKRYELEGGILYLDFNAKYKQMDTVEETLVRAALVKSLVRIEGINSVWIKVEGADQIDQDRLRRMQLGIVAQLSHLGSKLCLIILEPLQTPADEAGNQQQR